MAAKGTHYLAYGRLQGHLPNFLGVVRRFRGEHPIQNECLIFTGANTVRRRDS
jgi:hypothetical protein